MKIVKIYLLLPIILPLNNLFSQIFIDQDKIDEIKVSKIQTYDVDKKSRRGNVYLEHITRKYGYFSDVYVGFDKENYFAGDTIEISFWNPINENDNEEQIFFNNNSFSLKPGEEKKMKISTKNDGNDIIRIVVTLGKISFEERQYIIFFDTTKKDTLELNKIE